MSDYTNVRLKYFQDRVPEIAAFDTLLNESRAWILAFDGFSGHGKSTLIEWLEINKCQSHLIPYCTYSFARYTDYKVMLDILLSHTGLKSHLPEEAHATYKQRRESYLEDRDRRIHSITI